MTKQDEGLEPSAEEKKADEQGLAEVKEDELRGKIAKDLDIDPDNEGDLLDKLVERETKQRTKLSKTIKQKIGWREKAQKKTSKKPDGDKPKPGDKPKAGDKPKETPDVDKLVDEKFDAKMAERDLKDLALPEEIETQVKKLAKLNGISVREAAKDPYIVSKIEEFKKEERIKSASPKRSNKGTYKTNIDPSKPLNPEDFALDTKEGRKAWRQAKAAKRKHEESKT